MSTATIDTEPTAGPEITPRNDREIFRFWDGSRDWAVDPIRAMRTLIGHKSFDVKTDPELAKVGDDEATERTLQAVRDAFGVTTWSKDRTTGQEAGLTDAECLRLLSDFGIYLDSLKKNSSPMPTSQPATDSTDSPPPPPGSPPPSDTNELSDCISTSTDLKPAE